MLPPRAFVDPEVLEWELGTIFRGWICVGHASRVTEPGTYMMREIGSDSVVVMDGELKATPHMDEVEDFDTSCWGLMPVRVATVGGLVLVDLSGDASAVEPHVGQLAGHLDRYR